MKINDIYESTTAGSVATVAQPMTGKVLKRSNVGQGVYPNQKAGSLFTGKKSVSEEWTHGTKQGNTSHWSGTVNTGKYIHNGNVVAIYTGFEHPSTGRQSHIKVKFLPTGKVRQFSNTRSGFNEAEKWIRSDWRLQGSAADRPGNTFESAKTKKSKNEFDAELDSKGRFTKDSVRKMFNGKLSPDAKGIKEAHLDEDELIIMPGQGHRLKSGFIPHDHDRRDHEVEMARGDLFQAAKNAKQTFEMLQGVSEDQGLEGWVQAKITKAADYLNSVRQYLEGKQVREMTGGVIAGGGVGEAADPIEKRITVKKWGGNDEHSWAVLVDGKPAVTGLSKREVPHYKSQVMKKLREKSQLTGTNIEEGIFGSKPKKGDRVVHGNPAPITAKVTGLQGAYIDSVVRKTENGWEVLTSANPNQIVLVAPVAVTAKMSTLSKPNFWEIIRVIPKKTNTAEGAKVDRMVKHIEKSEEKTGKSKKEAKNIAWATANNRGMLDNKNKKG
jgi:hypothetical protein